LDNHQTGKQPPLISPEIAMDILNSLQEHVVYYDREMKIIWANDAACYSVGLPLADLREKNCWSIWAQREEPCTDCPVIRAIENNQPCIIEKDTIDGRSWLVKGYPLKDACGEVIGGIETTLDITDRKNAEKALKESEEKYHKLFDFSNDGIFIHDLQGNIIDVNRKVLELFGYAREEILHRKVQDLHPPEALEKARQAFKTVVDQRIVRFEILFTRKNGEPFIADVSSSLFYLSGQPVVQGIVRDVTQLKAEEKEKRKLERQLQLSQKFEAIGTLSGGIAHDFNNLLMEIQGRASLMNIDVDAGHPFKEHLTSIQECVRSATGLTRQLLGLARGGKYDVRPIDINELLRGSAALFGRTRKEIRIHSRLSDSAPVVDADRNQLEQVFLNIFVNAWQAMPDGGEIYLETTIAQLDAVFCRSNQAQPGPYAKIAITDTGIGIDASARERIFDPFFTTKDKGRGTGLGLASAYGIVKNHGGIITVYSEVGRGSTFNIYLPLSKHGVSRKAPERERLSQGTETILLVDDEAAIIAVGRAMLERLGYRVMVAQGGEAAIAAVETNGAEIDLVILDMIMPGIDGGKAFDRIRALRPDIPVLLSSGYSLNGQAQDIMQRGCNGFIQKPFEMAELSQKIRSILNSSGDHRGKPSADDESVSRRQDLDSIQAGYDEK